MPRRLRPALISAAVFAAALGAVAAFAPPPNDPSYAPPCPAGPHVPSPSCENPAGQWNLLSYWWNNAPDPGHGSGISADLAWSITVGRRDTVVAVLDSGVNYDHQDLANKIWLSCGELPAPQNAAGQTTPGSSPGCREPGHAYDANGDGVFNVQDYANDPRVSASSVPPTAALTRGDLRVFENGVDDDHNGFVDDISGWDARDGDGDEYDTTRFGHGTGRNGIIGAQGDNGAGIVGVCPECSLANVRVDATFVTRTEGPAIGALWAADHGFQVINMALGATSASSMARAAFDYYTRHNGLAINASANEFSFHQNFQSVFDDVMTIGAVAPDFDTVQGQTNPVPTTTYLRKANFSNYGAHLDVVAPTDVPTTGMGTTSYGDSSGTSSATPHAAGVAGLVFSRAHDLIDSHVLDTSPLALKDISAQEVRQIINGTADDVTVTDDPGGAGAYPYLVGWDRWTGYGRINAFAAVQRVGAGTIPPEADINSPDWYRQVGRTDPLVPVRFYANARWATGYDWVLEVGAGIEPASFTQIATSNGEASDPALSSANGVSNYTRTWDTTGLTDGFYTLRLRVTDALGNEGEDRMGVWIQRATTDPEHPGWPQTIAGVDGVRPSSLESIGSALVDLDGDNQLEIIVSSGDGLIHAFRQDGSGELPGWPVHTDPVAPLPLAESPAFDGDPSNGEIPIGYSSVVGGVSVADIDGDTVQDVCASSYSGKVWCWSANGALLPGFPAETDKGITRDQYTGVDKLNANGDAVLAPPALADLDGDGTFELLAGSFDQKMYVWNHDGTRRAPWPKAIFDAGQTSGVNTQSPKAIISVPVVGDIDDDGTLDLVFGTNEVYGGAPQQYGRLYAYDVNGNLKPGWPVQVGPSPSAGAVPLVAEGVGTSPVAADIDGDGKLEIATGVLLSPVQIFASDGSQFALMNPAPGSGGGGHNDGDEATPEGGRGSEPSLHYVALGAFADLEGAGALSYLNGTLGIGIGTLAIGSGVIAPLDFQLSAWDASSGAQKPSFPRLLEDWQFFTGAAVADLDGGVDRVPEIVVSSGGYFVHAFNGVTGLEASGFPKNVGQWVVSSPLVGDVDGDGQLEVVVATRSGDLHVWDMPGAACRAPVGGGPTVSTVQWRKALHDEWGTATYGRDTLRPAAIGDLAYSAGNLTFTGVGDDGHCGNSYRYELRQLPGTVVPNWSAAGPGTSVSGSADGAPQSFGGFDGTSTVMVRAFDEAGNGSPVAVNFPEPSRAAGMAAAVALLCWLGRRRRT